MYNNNRQDSPHLSRSDVPHGETFFIGGNIVDIKKPTTHEQQVQLIMQKGFAVDNVSECTEFLRQTNYYRLKAYFLPFRNRSGEYFRGISFKRIQNIYKFDSELRAVLFKVIEKTECYIRSQLSYYIANQYGALSYLDENIFSQKHNHTLFLDKIRQCIDEHSQTSVVKHHNAKYDGQFPIWVIVEFFSMGMLSYFYSDLKAADQKIIAREAFNTVPACLKSWLRCLTDLRNRCAHYSRLYYWTFSAIPQFPKMCEYRADRKLFSQIFMMKYLYPDVKEWNVRVVNDIDVLIKQYDGDISLKHMGFHNDWKQYLFN